MDISNSIRRENMNRVQLILQAYILSLGTSVFAQDYTLIRNVPISSRAVSTSEEVLDVKLKDACKGISSVETQKKIEAILNARRLPACSIKPSLLSKADSAILSYTFGDNKSLETAKSIINQALKQTDFDVNKPPQSLQDLFGFISLTPQGRKIISNAPFKDFKIKLVSETEMRMKTNSYAAFYDNEEKIIYLNRTASLGVAAPIFLHELTHALNTSAHKAFTECKRHLILAAEAYDPDIKNRTNLELDTVDEIAEHLWYSGKNQFMHDHFTSCMSIPDYLDERQAYDKQFEFIEELRKVSSCYGKWIDIKEKDGEIVASRFTDSEILSHYPQLIDKDIVISYAAERHINLTAPLPKAPIPSCDIPPSLWDEYNRPFKTQR